MVRRMDSATPPNILGKSGTTVVVAVAKVPVAKLVQSPLDRASLQMQL